MILPFYPWCNTGHALQLCAANHLRAPDGHDPFKVIVDKRSVDRHEGVDQSRGLLLLPIGRKPAAPVLQTRFEGPLPQIFLRFCFLCGMSALKEAERNGGATSGSRLCTISTDASSLVECPIITCKSQRSFLSNGFMSLARLARGSALTTKNGAASSPSFSGCDRRHSATGFDRLT